MPDCVTAQRQTGRQRDEPVAVLAVIWAAKGAAEERLWGCSCSDAELSLSLSIVSRNSASSQSCRKCIHGLI